MCARRAPSGCPFFPLVCRSDFPVTNLCNADSSWMPSRCSLPAVPRERSCAFLTPCGVRTEKQFYASRMLKLYRPISLRLQLDTSAYFPLYSHYNYSFIDIDSCHSLTTL